MPSVTPAIPANQIVSINPSVIGPGGNALDLIGLMLTQSTRLPIGQVLSFPNAPAVSSYFGAASTEAADGAIYFKGFDNSHRKPGALIMAQYNIAPVSAWLRGSNISSMSLASLQALNGTVSVTVDGVVHSGSVNLSAATSFSSAAQIIGDVLNLPAVPEVAVVTGSITTTLLTVTAIQSGVLGIGDLITGSGVTAGTYIVSLGTGTGGTGTYNVNTSQTVTSTTITATQPAAIFTGAIATTVLTVSAVAAGTLAVGQIISGAGVTSGTYIISLGTGTGGTGTYNLSVSQTVSSESMTAEAPGVTYDSTSGGFVITSATLGPASTIGYGSGAIATNLGLTQAVGATLSQGAAANTPGTSAPLTFMPTIVTTTTNWASFMTMWEPNDQDKESFATWTSNQNNRYLYAMWTTNILNTQSNGPAPPAAFVNAGNLSGIAMIYEDPTVDVTGGQLGAFLLGAVASLDFTQFNGRATMAFRSQQGLQPQVFSATVAANLLSFGINFYGDYTTANNAFTFFYNGAVSGQFKWIDSYVNQIWMNNGFQLDFMELLTQVYSIPYNTAGKTLIEAAAKDTIQAAVNFGAIRTGLPLSPSEVAEVNNAAGVDIDRILTQQGWYMQVLDTDAATRAARASPPCTFWYTDGQSVQKINLASIELL